jgi:hypothetical protein
MRKIIVSMMLVLMSYSVKADDFNIPSVKSAGVINLDNRDIPTPVKPSVDKGIFSKDESQTNQTKEWTVMVFMNANNNLSEGQLFGLVGKWGTKDIDEMKKVGSTDKVNVVVEFSETGKGAKRMLILKKGILNSGEKVYLTDPKADMGDYRRVIDFVKWSKQTFPAKKYMLIIWNHGLGWIDPVMSNHTAGTGTSKGISFDDNSKNYIRTKQLGEILKNTGYVDVFAMNACLMQMAEVAYEIKDYTGLIVGSEETMLAYGFNYEKLLNFINSNPNSSKTQMSDFFINWYKQFFSEGANVGPATMPLDSVAATLSTLEPSAVKELPQYLSYLATVAMKNDEKDAVKSAVSSVIRFTSIADPTEDKKKMIAPYVDLYDFARIISENAKNSETKKAANTLMSFIKNKLVIRSVGINKDAENNYDYTKVGGIAINMTMKVKPVPPAYDDILETKYQDLSLSNDSSWDEFVSWSDKVWSEN